MADQSICLECGSLLRGPAAYTSPHSPSCSQATARAVTDETLAKLKEVAGWADGYGLIAIAPYTAYFSPGETARILAAVERDRDRVVLQSCSACGHQLDPVEPRVTRCVHCDAIAPTLTREQEDEVIRRRVNELADGTDSLCYGTDYFGEALDMPVRDVLVALGVTPPQK